LSRQLLSRIKLASFAIVKKLTTVSKGKGKENTVVNGNVFGRRPGLSRISGIVRRRRLS
jgi:hypothetical protein